MRYHIKATTTGKILFLGPQTVALIEISTASEINEDLHDGVGISLGTRTDGPKEEIPYYN